MAVQIIPGEISSFTVAIAIFSGCILFFGYISLLLKERLFLSEALVAVLVGIIVGPAVSNFMNPYHWQNYQEITKQLTRCIIAIQVLTVGIELPHRYLKHEWQTILVFLMPVMIYMWILESLLISACICPTDPILANSVVKGHFAAKHVPHNIRNALAAESGANDGMGFPFLFLALFLISEDSTAKAVGKWFYLTWLFQILLSCIIGIVAGWAAKKVLLWSEKNYFVDKPSFLSFTMVLALFLMSLTGFSGSDDLLACFVAGNVFSWDNKFKREAEEVNFQEVIDTMLNLSVFVYIGTIIPWWEFNNLDLGLEPWRLILAAFLILFFRRLPSVILLKPIIPAIKTYREAVFSGWFGPIGVGAVFLSSVAREELENVYEGREQPISTKIIGPVVLFIVFSSIVIHGTTVPLFKFGKQTNTRGV
ncbi:Cation/H+ exchanger, partial [Sporodiniella umbellata]